MEIPKIQVPSIPPVPKVPSISQLQLLGSKIKLPMGVKIVLAIVAIALIFLAIAWIVQYRMLTGLKWTANATFEQVNSEKIRVKSFVTVQNSNPISVRFSKEVLIYYSGQNLYAHNPEGPKVEEGSKFEDLPANELRSYEISFEANRAQMLTLMQQMASRKMEQKLNMTITVSAPALLYDPTKWFVNFMDSVASTEFFESMYNGGKFFFSTIVRAKSVELEVPITYKAPL